MSWASDIIKKKKKKSVNLSILVSLLPFKEAVTKKSRKPTWTENCWRGSRRQAEMKRVENEDKHGEQKTIEKFGVQRVTQPGLPFFTWRLWLEARDTHTHKGKHRRSHTHHKNWHTCMQTHSRYTADSGNKVEGHADKHRRRHTHTHSVCNPGANQALLPLFHYTLGSLVAFCFPPPLCDEGFSCSFAVLFSCQPSRPETEWRTEGGERNYKSCIEHAWDTSTRTPA